MVKQHCAHFFTRNWQLPLLNQQKGENDRRKYFMINLHERILPTAGVEPPTSWSPVGRPSNIATKAGLCSGLSVPWGLLLARDSLFLVQAVTRQYPLKYFEDCWQDYRTELEQVDWEPSHIPAPAPSHISGHIKIPITFLQSSSTGLSLVKTFTFLA